MTDEEYYQRLRLSADRHGVTMAEMAGHWERGTVPQRKRGPRGIPARWAAFRRAMTVRAAERRVDRFREGARRRLAARNRAMARPAR